MASLHTQWNTQSCCIHVDSRLHPSRLQTILQYCHLGQLKQPQAQIAHTCCICRCCLAHCAAAARAIAALPSACCGLCNSQGHPREAQSLYMAWRSHTRDLYQPRRNVM